jgi:hypothetical protein
MFKSLKDLPNAISWSFGLGWLSWLVMGTPFQESIVTGLRWSYRAQLRPARLEGTKIHDAYRQKLIDPEEWNWLLEIEGWRNRDKAILYELTERDFPDTVLRDGYLYGLYPTDDIMKELRRKGYSEIRARTLLYHWKIQRRLELIEKLYKEYEDLFIADKTTETQLRSIAKSMGYDNEEIELLVNIANAKKVKDKRLTYSQVITAMSRGEIGIAKAEALLLGMGYSKEDVDIMIRTAQKK